MLIYVAPLLRGASDPSQAERTVLRSW